ncbi:sensor histidine kinase [Amycolatopsis sp. YIM 10]|uniref:sensor histidine kinase n=1 Tax=Amycolatopsis sp. YIM 10 TaxID=2653857 RepID=UPI0012901739|nr:ATP-binding protein [Amycolatopsis sp. YIM 10]QFU91141.1 Sensor histidine kinase LiaS [Amycolatopsis sp. YIM 10]
MSGEAVRLLGAFGHRYAAAVRLATLVPIGAVALLQPAPGAFASTLLAVVVAGAWTGGYCWWLAKGEGRTGTKAMSLDVAVLMCVYLSVLWTDAVAAANTGWLRLLILFACVTWQWHTSLTAGLIAAAVAGGASSTLVIAGDPADPTLLQSQTWAPVIAVVSRVAWVLITRAAERADRMAAEAERARTEAAVAEAMRAEERELANSLHDTAATTLLMVGAGQVPPDASWLSVQARRDLDRLRSQSGPPPDRADLVGLLRDDLDGGYLTVEFDGPPRLLLPFDVATAIAGAAQEALNNVHRHAGTDRATVRLHGDDRALWVEIADEGRGFDVSRAPATRRGLRESVHGRMSHVGGTAVINSAEGSGTVVRLEWRAGTPDDLDHAELTRIPLRRGLRIATLLVAVAGVAGLGLANLLGRLDEHDAPAAQFAAFAVLAGLLAAEVVLVARHRSWGRLAGPAVSLVFAASVLSYLTLPDGPTSAGVDWAFGAANWVGLVVLVDRPFRTVAAFLAGHELLAFANLALSHDLSRDSLALFATGSVTVVGFPLCLVVLAAVLGRIGAQAAAAARELEGVRTADAVALAAHRRRVQRFAELSATSVPLLEGLADGSLTPSDPEVQRRSAVEAARMRRLFAERDLVDNPLLHELRYCADIADRKGVEVELDVRGQWPVPPVVVRRDLTDAALAALATAASWARVTVVGSEDLVSVSVVADCAEAPPPAPATGEVRVESFIRDGMVWLEARWRPN